MLDWREGRVAAREVQEAAEARVAEVEWLDLPRADPRSIEYEVLCQLDILNQQLITEHDADAILRFLATPHGREESGWAEWSAYWEGMDYEARKASLKGHPYYGLG